MPDRLARTSFLGGIDALIKGPSAATCNATEPRARCGGGEGGEGGVGGGVGGGVYLPATSREHLVADLEKPLIQVCEMHRTL